MHKKRTHTVFLHCYLTVTIMQHSHNSQTIIYNKRPLKVYVGIDPQPTLLSVNCCLEDNTTIVAWFNHYLKKKATFVNAQGWQVHIYEECHKLLHQVIPNACSEKCFPRACKIELVTIEQQKGRVNTILEQTLLCVCKALNLNVHIIHPLTWKKEVGISCTGTNKKNKDTVVEATKTDFELHFGVNTNNTQLRIHDLCDAFQIRKAGYFKATHHNLNTDLMDLNPQ